MSTVVGAQKQIYNEVEDNYFQKKDGGFVVSNCVECDDKVPIPLPTESELHDFIVRMRYCQALFKEYEKHEKHRHQPLENHAVGAQNQSYNNKAEDHYFQKKRTSFFENEDEFCSLYYGRGGYGSSEEEDSGDDCDFGDAFVNDPVFGAALDKLEQTLERQGF